MMKTRRPILALLFTLAVILGVIGLRSPTVAAYPAPPPGAVFLGGDAGQYLAMVDGGAVGWTCVNLAGGSASICPGTLPAADLAAGSNGQCLTTSGGTSQWGTCGGGGITAGTGDTTFSGSGSVVTTTVQAQGGVETFGASGQIGCSAAATACELYQASESTTTIAADMAIQPQFSTHATDQQGGNLNLALQSGAGSGLDPFVNVTYGAVPTGSFGTTKGLGTGFFGIWAGSANAGLTNATGSNFAFVGSSNTSQFNAPSGGAAYFTVGGLNQNDLNQNASGFQFFDNGAFDLASGSGVIGMTAATTNPTTGATNGPVLYADHTNKNFCVLGRSGTVSCLPN